MNRGLLLFACLTSMAAAATPSSRATAHIPLRGALNEFLVESLNERVQKARRPGPPANRAADLIVFELATRPADLPDALAVADAIHKLRDQGVATAALVGKPGSASDTLLALACDQLFMADRAALEPIDPDAFASPPSDARRQLLAALARYSAWRPRTAPLYQAMADPEPEVHVIVFEGLESKPKFVSAADHRRLMATPPSPIVRSERVARAGTFPVLAAADALRIGLSSGTVNTVDILASRLDISPASLVTLEQKVTPVAAQPPPAKGRAAKAASEPAPALKDSRIKPRAEGQVIFIPLDDMVGEGMRYSLARRLEMARKLFPALIVFEVNTYGGRLDSALSIANDIFAIEDPPTVAYVNSKAISAGALISIACDEIVMQSGGSLGDCQPVDTSGKAVRSEKIDTVLRTRFRTFCDGKYPAALGQSMVTMEIEVYQLETRDGQREYVTDKEYQNLLRSPEELERYKNPKNAKKIVHEDELLTMNDREALDYGFSRATVKSRQQVLELYGLADREIITFKWSWSEKLVQLLDRVGPLLLALGVLGIMIELKTPGFGIFGIIGLSLIGVFFFGKYTAHLAEVWEILLFFVGVLLLGIEIFVTPGFGVIGVAGLLCMVTSILLSLQHFAIPRTPLEYELFADNIVTVGIVALLIFAGAIGIARYLHRAPYLGKIVLPPPPSSTAPTAVSQAVSPPPAPQAQKERAQALVGRRGRAVTMLRPAGSAEFDGEPLDVVTQGDFIRPGEAIEICGVKGNRTIVRRAT